MRIHSTISLQLAQPAILKQTYDGVLFRVPRTMVQKNNHLIFKWLLIVFSRDDKI